MLAVRFGVNQYLIHNYPYDPRNFVQDRQRPTLYIHPTRDLSLRLYPLSGRTNWDKFGNITFIQRTFDYGLPSTNPVPVVLRIDKPSSVLSAQIKRAEAGSAAAQYLLGKRYLKGDGVEKDLSLARHWFEKAAAQGDEEAKAALAAIP